MAESGREAEDGLLKQERGEEEAYGGGEGASHRGTSSGRTSRDEEEKAAGRCSGEAGEGIEGIESMEGIERIEGLGVSEGIEGVEGSEAIADIADIEGIAGIEGIERGGGGDGSATRGKRALGGEESSETEAEADAEGHDGRIGDPAASFASESAGRELLERPQATRQSRWRFAALAVGDEAVSEAEPATADASPLAANASSPGASAQPPPSSVAVDTERVSAARTLWRQIDRTAKQGSKKPARITSIEQAAQMLRAKKAAARFAKYDLRNEIAHVLADPNALELDLSANTQFTALTSQQKNRIMSALAHGASLEYLQLNTLKIDNTCAPSLVAMARALKRLRVLSLEGNRLSESGLLVLAKGLAGHPCLSELHLADQHTPISVKAVDSLIEMIEQTPTLTRLNTGTLRDHGLRWRLQAVIMANTEKQRQQRHRPGSFGELSERNSAGDAEARSDGDGVAVDGAATAECVRKIATIIDVLIDTSSAQEAEEAVVTMGQLSANRAAAANADASDASGAVLGRKVYSALEGPACQNDTSGGASDEQHSECSSAAAAPRHTLCEQGDGTAPQQRFEAMCNEEARSPRGTRATEHEVREELERLRRENEAARIEASRLRAEAEEARRAHDAALTSNAKAAAEAAARPAAGAATTSTSLAEAEAEERARSAALRLAEHLRREKEEELRLQHEEREQELRRRQREHEEELSCRQRELEEELTRRQQEHEKDFRKRQRETEEELRRRQREQEEQLLQKQRETEEALQRLQQEQEQALRQKRRETEDSLRMEERERQEDFLRKQREHEAALLRLRKETQDALQEQQKHAEEALQRRQREQEDELRLKQLKQEEELQRKQREAEEEFLRTQREREEALRRHQKEREEALEQLQKEKEEALERLQKEKEQALERQQKEMEEALLRKQREQEATLEEQRREKEEALQRRAREQEEALLRKQIEVEQELQRKHKEQEKVVGAAERSRHQSFESLHSAGAFSPPLDPSVAHGHGAGGHATTRYVMAHSAAEIAMAAGKAVAAALDNPAAGAALAAGLASCYNSRAAAHDDSPTECSPHDHTPASTARSGVSPYSGGYAQQSQFESSAASAGAAQHGCVGAHDAFVSLGAYSPDPQSLPCLVTRASESSVGYRRSSAQSSDGLSMGVFGSDAGFRPHFAGPHYGGSPLMAPDAEARARVAAAEEEAAQWACARALDTGACKHHQSTCQLVDAAAARDGDAEVRLAAEVEARRRAEQHASLVLATAAEAQAARMRAEERALALEREAVHRAGEANRQAEEAILQYVARTTIVNATDSPSKRCHAGQLDSSSTASGHAHASASASSPERRSNRSTSHLTVSTSKAASVALEGAVRAREAVELARRELHERRREAEAEARPKEDRALVARAVGVQAAAEAQAAVAAARESARAPRDSTRRGECVAVAPPSCPAWTSAATSPTSQQDTDLLHDPLMTVGQKVGPRSPLRNGCRATVVRGVYPSPPRGASAASLTSDSEGAASPSRSGGGWRAAAEAETRAAVAAKRAAERRAEEAERRAEEALREAAEQARRAEVAEQERDTSAKALRAAEMEKQQRALRTEAADEARQSSTQTLHAAEALRVQAEGTEATLAQVGHGTVGFDKAMRRSESTSRAVDPHVAAEPTPTMLWRCQGQVSQNGDATRPEQSEALDGGAVRSPHVFTSPRRPQNALALAQRDADAAVAENRLLASPLGLAATADGGAAAFVQRAWRGTPAESAGDGGTHELLRLRADTGALQAGSLQGSSHFSLAKHAADAAILFARNEAWRRVNERYQPALPFQPSESQPPNSYGTSQAATWHSQVQDTAIKALTSLQVQLREEESKMRETAAQGAAGPQPFAGGNDALINEVSPRLQGEGIAPATEPAISTVTAASLRAAADALRTACASSLRAGVRQGYHLGSEPAPTPQHAQSLEHRFAMPADGSSTGSSSAPRAKGLMVSPPPAQVELEQRIEAIEAELNKMQHGGRLQGASPSPRGPSQSAFALSTPAQVGRGGQRALVAHDAELQGLLKQLKASRDAAMQELRASQERAWQREREQMRDIMGDLREWKRRHGTRSSELAPPKQHVMHNMSSAAVAGTPPMRPPYLVSPATTTATAPLPLQGPASSPHPAAASPPARLATPPSLAPTPASSGHTRPNANDIGRRMPSCSPISKCIADGRGSSPGHEGPSLRELQRELDSLKSSLSVYLGPGVSPAPTALAPRCHGRVHATY